MGLISLIVTILTLLLCAPKLIEYLVHYYIHWRKRSEKILLSGQVLAYRKELRNISQADEFAKYSKIQRKLKVVEQQYNDHLRRDLEIQLTYVAIGKFASYFLIVILCSCLIYQLFHLALSYTGVYPLGDERSYS